MVDKRYRQDGSKMTTNDIIQALYDERRDADAETIDAETGEVSCRIDMMIEKLDEVLKGAE